MKCFPAHFYLFLSLLAAGGCRLFPHPEGRNPDPVAFEDSIYCFNGRSTVLLDGKWGIVDTLGHVILKPEWDGIEFLNDDIALLRRSGMYYLSTRDGRILGGNPDPDALAEQAEELRSVMEEEDYTKWDRVLDHLAALCDACLAGSPGKIDNAMLQEKAALESALEEVSGRLSPMQEERLEKIVDKFNSLYHR